MRRFKEVLIFVAGGAPQVISEAIFALSQKKPPVLADEIYVITTSLGRRIIQETLIKRNILGCLAKEYNLRPISLSEDNLIVPRDKQGREIEDIVSKEDNEIIGDLITSFIREKAKDEGTRLHCSLAGGRKTMSFYLGSALQLFGRPWDKLYHVLVTPEFEANPEFYYKPKKNKIIATRDRNGNIRHLNTRGAQIYLAELPFIRLGPKLRLQGENFRELVAEGQKEIDVASIQAELRVKLRERTLTIGDKAIYFQPMLLFVYLAFLNQKINSCSRPSRPYCYECRDCFVDLNTLFNLESLKNLIHYYEAIFGGMPLKGKEFLRKWEKYNGFPSEVVRQYLSKIKAILRRELIDGVLYPFYLVSPLKAWGASRYGLRLEKSKIFIE